MPIPQFISAEELSLSLQKHGVEIAAERLTYLAEIGQMPHVRCDGGPPLFRKQEVKEWIAENLITENQGQRVPVSISVIEPQALGGFVRGVPEELVGMTEWLREFPLGLIRQVCCIYFLVKSNRVVYVGKSDVLANRLMTHFKDKDFDRALFLRAPREDASAIELAFIKLLKPPLNSEREKLAIESQVAFYNGHANRYLRVMDDEVGEPSVEEKSRLLRVIDRLEHDHGLATSDVGRHRGNNETLKRLLGRALDRIFEGDPFDRSNPADRLLADQIQCGISFGYSGIDIKESDYPDGSFP